MIVGQNGTARERRDYRHRQQLGQFPDLASCIGDVHASTCNQNRAACLSQQQRGCLDVRQPPGPNARKEIVEIASIFVVAASLVWSEDVLGNDQGDRPGTSTHSPAKERRKQRWQLVRRVDCRKPTCRTV